MHDNYYYSPYKNHYICRTYQNFITHSTPKTHTIMNKLYRICATSAALLATAWLAAGCVNKTYDPANIAPGQNFQVVGDVISTPTLIDARISFEGLMGGLSEIEQLLADYGYTLEDIGNVAIPIPTESFRLEIPMETSLDPSLLGNKEGDTLVLMLDIESTLAIATTFDMAFVTNAGTTVSLADNLPIHAATPQAPYKATEEIDLTSLVDQLSDVQSIVLILNQIDIREVVFHLDDILHLGIRLEKTGGLTLN